MQERIIETPHTGKKSTENKKERWESMFASAMTADETMITDFGAIKWIRLVA
jgi:hypothetical protein